MRKQTIPDFWKLASLWIAHFNYEFREHWSFDLRKGRSRSLCFTIFVQQLTNICLTQQIIEAYICEFNCQQSSNKLSDGCFWANYNVKDHLASDRLRIHLIVGIEMLWFCLCYLGCQVWKVDIWYASTVQMFLVLLAW